MANKTNTISWSAAADETTLNPSGGLKGSGQTYKIERSQYRYYGYSEITNSPTDNLTTTDVVDEAATWFYRVWAKDNADQYSICATLPLKFPSYTPTTPTSFEAAYGGATQNDLSWVESTDTDNNILGYKIAWNTGDPPGEEWQIITVGIQSSYQHQGLTAGTQYNYKILCFDEDENESAYSGIESTIAGELGSVCAHVLTLTLSIGVVAVENSVGITCPVATQSLTVSTPEPVIATEINTTILANAFTLTASMPTATVGGGAIATVSALSLTVSIPTITVLLTTSVTAQVSTLSLTLSFSAPVIDARQNVYFDVGVLVLTIAIPAVGVEAGGMISIPIASPLSLTSEILAVTIIADVLISAPVLTLTVSMPLTTITGDAVAELATLELSVSIPTFSIVGDALFAAFPLVLQITLPAPTAVGEVEYAIIEVSNPLTLTASLGSPTIFIPLFDGLAQAICLIMDDKSRIEIDIDKTRVAVLADKARISIP